MRYLTEELYKKMQLFQLPLEDGITLDDLAEAFDIEPDEFLLQELLARDEWYDKYLPEPLHSQLFDQHGEVSFQQVDDELWQQINAFRQQTEHDWAIAMTKVKQQRQQLRQTASPELRQLLDLDLADCEIRKITGIDSKAVTVELYPQWDLGKILTLRFEGVKDSWMGKFHPDDANWWLVDELLMDEEQREGRYQLHALFGNAEYVSQLQFSFADVALQEREDPLGF